MNERNEWILYIGILKALHKLSFAYNKIYILQPEVCWFWKYILYPA